MDLGKFIQAPIDEISGVSKAREDARDARLLQSIKSEGSDSTLAGDIKPKLEADDDTHVQQLLRDAEEEEQRLLSGAVQVHCTLFEGQMLERTGSGYKQILDEWTNIKKRVMKNKETVVLNGMAFVVDPDLEQEQEQQ